MSAERPSVSGSERSSALGGVVAAGGGVTGSPLLSSILPGVAVHSVSASTSGIAAPAGAAASGVSAVRSTDPGSSSSQVSSVGARSSSGGFADASSFMDPGQEGIWEMLRLFQWPQFLLVDRWSLLRSLGGRAGVDSPRWSSSWSGSAGPSCFLVGPARDAMESTAVADGASQSPTQSSGHVTYSFRGK
uniref:Uncharacterized protein LOC117348910 isoform X3 n=1 Tax=Geotrypetes seraphini TaxID=260995 RepID=A0A6P8P1N2_GEOSA|nr:uncharacterized protein LOC117348910 isoform X3 [Geotrypetes seraphini]